MTGKSGRRIWCRFGDLPNHGFFQEDAKGAKPVRCVFGRDERDRPDGFGGAL